MYAASGGALLMAASAGAASLVSTVLLLMVCVGTTGIIMPTGSVLALEPHARIAGAASSLIGATVSRAGPLEAS